MLFWSLSDDSPPKSVVFFNAFPLTVAFGVLDKTHNSSKRKRLTRNRLVKDRYKTSEIYHDVNTSTSELIFKYKFRLLALTDMRYHIVCNTLASIDKMIYEAISSGNCYSHTGEFRQTVVRVNNENFVRLKKCDVYVRRHEIACSIRPKNLRNKIFKDLKNVFSEKYMNPSPSNVY